MRELHPIVIELMKKRGITEKSEMLEFLSDKPQKTYDPFLLRNMEAGVDLILSAVRSGKRICIYGDYDADGITSTAILWHVLSNLTDNLEYYIPSRFAEGYGLNVDAIDIIKTRGVDLIVTVDCGCVSYEEVEHAKNIGLEVVVTDHHSITDKKADCILINPKQADCHYPFKELAGCGVAFKLAQAIQKRAGLPKSVLNSVLDLVAVGTIGDIMPLVDENRTMVKYGLKALRSGRRESIRKLAEGASLKVSNINSENTAFVIVPHVNAVGRLTGTASAAADMLISEDHKKMDEAVEILLQNNKDRKHIQDKIFEICDEIVQKDMKDEKILILRPETSHEGIAGIVAGKLKEKYYRPAIIVSPSGEFLKGTGRSIEGINIYELLKAHEELFEKFGGHAVACGFLIKQENFETLRNELINDVNMIFLQNPKLFEIRHFADMMIDIGSITEDFLEQLELMAPFGNKNPRPEFELRAVSLTNIAFMGQSGQHMRFKASDKYGNAINCVFFNRAQEYCRILQQGGHFNLIGSPECSEWNGTRRIQFIVTAIQNTET